MLALRLHELMCPLCWDNQEMHMTGMLDQPNKLMLVSDGFLEAFDASSDDVAFAKDVEINAYLL